MKILIFLLAITSVANAGFFSALLGSLTGSASTKSSVTAPAVFAGPGGVGYGRGGPPIQLLAAAGGHGPNPSSLAGFGGAFGGGGPSFGSYSQSGYAQGFNGGGSSNFIIKQSPAGFPGAYSPGSFGGFGAGGPTLLSGGYGNGGAPSTIKLIHQGGGYGSSSSSQSSNFAGLSGGYAQSQPQTIKLIHQKGQSSGFNGGGFTSGYSTLNSGKTVKLISDNSNSAYSSNVAFPSDGPGVGPAKTIRIIHEKPYGGSSASFSNSRQVPTTIKIVKENGPSYSTSASYSSGNTHDSGDIKTIKIINEASSHLEGTSGSYAGGYSHISSNSFNDGPTKTLHVIKEQGGFVPSPTFGSSHNEDEKTIKIVDDGAASLGGGYSVGGSYPGNSYSNSYETGSSTGYYAGAYNDGITNGNGNNEQTIKVISDGSPYNSDAAITNGAYAGAAYSSGGNNAAEQTLQIIDEGSSGGTYSDGFANDYSSAGNSYSQYSSSNSLYSGAPVSENGISSGITNGYSSNNYHGNPESVKTIQVIQDNNIDSSGGSSYSNGGYGQQEDIKTIKIINEGAGNDINGRYQNHLNSYNSGGSNVKTIQIIHENGIGGSSGGSYSNNGYSNGSDDHIKTIQILDDNSRFIKKK
ncbi:uncharacterized transmembrane protein DDB_G0289901-like [Condylostylus longicornis]|uniref:uncharacterized transmembrane protein DDB_G0289901-like n=1 Tax=Condylostylus longicornis TaxID=2530218 RepID=UPI00244E0F1F|nr:uncharacterized transmembrane protein DDB_G0289901-like [Condylostylus longicornis]